MSGGVLAVATFNFEDGGWSREHDDYRTLPLLADVVGQVPDVDVLLFQEGRAYDADGQGLLFKAEQLLAPFGLRGFLTRSDRGQLHEIVFVRWPKIRPVRHYTPDLPGVFHDQVGVVHLRVPGLEPVLAVKSVQWPHWNGDARLDAAQKLTRYAAPSVAAIIGGDFNSLWPDCSDHTEFEPDWQVLPRHKRHKALPPGLRPDGRVVSDRRALSALVEAGFVSVGCVAGDMTVTVNDHADHGQGARIDHILVSPLLASAVSSDTYQVWANPLGDRASDHRLVSVALRLGGRAA